MSDDLIERLLDGVIMHTRRWSGDTHADLGGSIKEAETDALMAEAADEIDRLRAENERLRGALEWYAEQASLCRLITSDGDPGRHRLANDGGKRARAALETGAPDWHGHRARAALDGDGELDA